MNSYVKIATPDQSIRDAALLMAQIEVSLGPRLSSGLIEMGAMNSRVRDHYRAAVGAALIALSATLSSVAQDTPAAQPLNEQSPDDAVKGPSAPPLLREPTVTVLDHREVQGTLGKEVRSAANEDMGRVIDVIVDRTGQVRAAIIDFGGFLGVGSRKIAVAWNALHFSPNADKIERIALELTRDQVRAAPEYKADKPVVVLGASGDLEPFQ